jgi:hypothetical protein
MWTERELRDGSHSIFHLLFSLFLTILQTFHLPSTFTILCLSKLPPTSDIRTTIISCYNTIDFITPIEMRGETKRSVTFSCLYHQLSFFFPYTTYRVFNLCLLCTGIRLEAPRFDISRQYLVLTLPACLTVETLA